jgi:hypothetical protein
MNWFHAPNNNKKKFSVVSWQSPEVWIRPLETSQRQYPMRSVLLRPDVGRRISRDAWVLMGTSWLFY